MTLTAPAREHSHQGQPPDSSAQTAVLSTIHGSHLYGLAGPDSDLDTYEVVLGADKRYAHQSTGQHDAFRIHLSRFQMQVAVGIPQALEALFSDRSVMHPNWAPMLTGLRPGVDAARATYRRTIVNFGLHRGGRTGAAAERVDTVKLRRHALRLCLNLDEMVRTGRFNPTLTDRQAAFVNQTARIMDGPEWQRCLSGWIEAAHRGRMHKILTLAVMDSTPAWS